MQYTTIFVSMGPQLRRCASWFGGPRSTSTVSISSISCHEQDKNHTNAMNIYLLWRYIHLRPPNRRGSFPYNPFRRVRRRGFQVLCQRAPRDMVSILAIKVHEILRAERIEILHEQCTTTCLNCCQTTAKRIGA
jgi:hypothetical protein